MDSLEQTIARFCDAWNRHDAGELAALWAEDGELHHPWGHRGVGREAIRELLLADHTGTMATSELTVQRIATNADAGTAAGTATAEIDAVLKGVRAPNGRPYDLPAVLSALFVRSDQGWKIRTMTPLANPRHRGA